MPKLQQRLWLKMEKTAKGHGCLGSKKVAHDFLKLKEWKDYATRTLFVRPNVVFVDIDEQNNQLSIGVNSSFEAEATKLFLKKNEIPGLVVQIIPIDSGPPKQINPGDPETLSNTQNLYGGVEVDPGGVYRCTLGFNAMLTAGDLAGYQTTYSPDHFFVTAAHCMSSLGTVTNTPVYQTGTSIVIGYEYRQPLWAGPAQNANCPAGF